MFCLSIVNYITRIIDKKIQVWLDFHNLGVD